MSAVRAWLALLRLPNLFTVPGDVLAGCFLAAGGGAVFLTPELGLVALASLLFYAAGLLLNDWADYAIDRAERPERPLPSGRVTRGRVLAAAFVLLLLALLLCLAIGGAVLAAGAALAGAIATYNLVTKNLPLAGPLNMGLCRGLNFLLGATLITGSDLPGLAWWGLATLSVYIVAVSHLAQREMTGRYFLAERWLPASIVVLAFFLYLPLSELIHWPAQVAVALLLLVAAAGAARTARMLPNRQGVPADPRTGPPLPTPALIGRLISFLLPLQAACIVGSSDRTLPFLLALAVLALWPVKRAAGKAFHAS